MSKGYATRVVSMIAQLNPEEIGEVAEQLAVQDGMKANLLAQCLLQSGIARSEIRHTVARPVTNVSLDVDYVLVITPCLAHDLTRGKYHLTAVARAVAQEVILSHYETDPDVATLRVLSLALQDLTQRIDTSRYLRQRFALEIRAEVGALQVMTGQRLVPPHGVMWSDTCRDVLETLRRVTYGSL